MSDSLIEDGQWATFAGDLFKITEFIPFCQLENGKLVDANATCLAMLKISCPMLSPDATGAVLYEPDFKHLWEVFKERGIKDGEVVIGSWIRQDVSKLDEAIRLFIPRMALMLCRGDAYELLIDRNYRPELRGAARWLAERPIEAWPPGIL